MNCLVITHYQVPLPPEEEYLSIWWCSSPHDALNMSLWGECICVVNKHNSLENSIRWYQYHRLLGWSKVERLNLWSECFIQHRSLPEHLGSMVLHHIRDQVLSVEVSTDLLGWVTLTDCMAILIGRTGQGAVSQRHFSLKLFTWSLQSHHRCSSTSLYDVLLVLFPHF